MDKNDLKVDKNGIWVPVLVKKEDYDMIERICRKFRTETSSWVNVVLSYKLNEMVLEAKNDGRGLLEW